MVNITFGPGELSTSAENLFLISDEKRTEFDYLVFLDSRGFTTNNNHSELSFGNMLKQEFDKHKLSYMIVSRPKNLTVFATLYNFLVLNTHISFKSLITNLGFVDCTPKKEENIFDIRLQINFFYHLELDTIHYETYKLNDGKLTMLKSLTYSSDYIKTLVNFLDLKFQKMILLTTPIISEVLQFQRKRPTSFYKQLLETNLLIKNIISQSKCEIQKINLNNDISTYDGVHFDTKGHELIFNIIKESIEL